MRSKVRRAWSWCRTLTALNTPPSPCPQMMFDFIRTFNTLTTHCFDACCNDFKRRQLEGKEVGAASRCERLYPGPIAALAHARCYERGIKQRAWCSEGNVWDHVLAWLRILSKLSTALCLTSYVRFAHRRKSARKGASKNSCQ